MIICNFATTKEMKSEIRHILPVLMLALLTAMTATGQTAITSANMLRSGDAVCMELLPYADAGKGGSGQTWDFSWADAQKGTHGITYTGDSIIVGLEDGIISRYRVSDGTLCLIGVETPLTTMRYDSPLHLLRFPMEVGDTLSSRFCGKGYYCDSQPTTDTGELFTIADGEGTLILTEEDTLYNVIRLHSICSVSHSIAQDSISMESGTIKQTIEERYTWYARGFRYPVLRFLSRTNYSDMQPVSLHQAGFRFLPEQQRLLPDSVNEAIASDDLAARQRQSSHQESWQSAASSVLTGHQITIHGKTVNVSYELNGPAHVILLVTGVSGMLHQWREQDYGDGGTYDTSFDCTSLRQGQYILYINVNGQVTSNKFKI